MIIDFNTTINDLGTPSLLIGDPQDFAGIISGFDSGDASDKIVLNAATWKYQGFSDGALMLSDGQNTTAIHLGGSYIYDPAQFSASVSGNTTTITYTQ